MCEEEARVVQMRPVEKAIPALSVPVGGSVADVLSLEAVVLGDGGVSSGAVGRYVYIGDVSVSGGVDTVVCGVDTVLSGAVGGGLCDHDRVSGGGDTEVCGVDMVVSGTVGGVCVTMAGCQEVVTWMCVVLTRWCRLLSVDVCVTLTGCHDVTQWWVLVMCQCLEEVSLTCVLWCLVLTSLCVVSTR